MKTKGLRIATRCTTLDQFVAAFHRFCDAQTVFISTLTPRTIGLETAFSIELADHTPALRGLGVVLESWPTPKNPFGRPGLQLGIRRLTADSEPIFDRLLKANDVALKKPPAAPPQLATVVVRAQTPRPVERTEPNPIVAALAADAARGATATDTTTPLAADDAPRTPGSELVLPANPLMNLTDESLEGFVDCTIYEETANYFPLPEDPNAAAADGEDPVAPPPAPAGRAPTAALIAIAAPIDVPAPPHAVALTTPPKGATIPPAVTSTIPPLDTTATPVVPVPVIRQRHAATPPPMPIVRLATDAAEEAPSVVTLAEPVAAAPAFFPPPPIDAPAEPLARPLAVPVYDHASSPSWRVRAASLMTGKRRWWVIGGATAATVTIAIALVVVMSRSKSEAAAQKPATDLVAENTPLPGEHARMSKAVADAKPEAEPDPASAKADPGDTGAAPVVGTGPCKMSISTTPAGSIISVDGDAAGPSPITVGGTCAKHKIDVAHPRYQTTTKWVTPTAGNVETVEVALPRPTHDLYVESQPSGATVSIDGHRAGTTPTMIKIMGFTTLTLTVEKPGLPAQSKKIYSKTPRDRAAFTFSQRRGSLGDVMKPH